jgi:hypothetical protein
VACRPAGSVSVTVTGPAGLQENSTAILKSNEAPACTVVGPVLIAVKQFCRQQRGVERTAGWSSEWEVLGREYVLLRLKLSSAAHCPSEKKPCWLQNQTCCYCYSYFLYIVTYNIVT